MKIPVALFGNAELKGILAGHLMAQNIDFGGDLFLHQPHVLLPRTGVEQFTTRMHMRTQAHALLALAAKEGDTSGLGFAFEYGTIQTAASVDLSDLDPLSLTAEEIRSPEIKEKIRERMAKATPSQFKVVSVGTMVDHKGVIVSASASILADTLKVCFFWNDGGTFEPKFVDLGLRLPKPHEPIVRVLSGTLVDFHRRVSTAPPLKN
jgi:hypothetical protein